jgi:hypothetical protein
VQLSSQRRTALKAEPEKVHLVRLAYPTFLLKDVGNSLKGPPLDQCQRLSGVKASTHLLSRVNSPRTISKAGRAGALPKVSTALRLSANHRLSHCFASGALRAVPGRDLQPDVRWPRRVSKDGDMQDRVSVHPSRRRASHGSSG